MKRIQYFSAFLRSPLRLGFVLLLTVAVGIVAGPGTVSAWSTNGDPTELTTRVDLSDSCSIASTGQAGPQPAGQTRTVYGVCYTRQTNPVSNERSAGDWLLASPRVLADVSEMRVCYQAVNCGSVQFSSTRNVIEGVPTLSAFQSTPCPGVARCVTYRFTFTGSTNSAWGTMPPAGTNAHLLVWPTVGFCSNPYCVSADSGNAQPVAYGVAQDAPVVPARWRWGAAYAEAPPVPPCALVEVSSGATVLGVTDYDDVLFPAGSSTLGVVLRTPGVSLVEGPTFRYRFSSDPVGAWSPLRQLVTSTSIASNGTGVYTWKPAVTAAQYASQLIIECDDGANGVRYWQGSTPGFANSPIWSTTLPVSRPCLNLTVDRSGNGSFSPGDLVALNYSLSGSTGVDLTASRVGDFAAVVVESYSLFGVKTGGTPSTVDVVPASTGTVRFTLPAGAVLDDYGPSSFRLICTDALGSIVVGPGTSFLPGVGAGIGASSSDVACWQTSGMSLTSPSTWITGMARMLSCVAQALFVPDGAVMLDKLREFNTTLSERPPFVVVAVVVEFGQDVYASFAATSGTGCFQGPAIPGVNADENMCIGAGLNIGAGQRSIMSLLLVVPMVIGMASQILALIGSRAEILEDANGQTSWNI